MITCPVPFVQSYNTKDISQVSPRLRRIYLELAEHDIALTWKPGAELVHVDAMSRNPVDPAEEMGPDPIDQQHQRLQDTINLIEEGDDEDDHPDNIQLQVIDPLYSGLFKAAAAHQGYSRQSSTGWMETTSTGRNCQHDHTPDNSNKHGLTSTL